MRRCHGISLVALLQHPATSQLLRAGSAAESLGHCHQALGEAARVGEDLGELHFVIQLLGDGGGGDGVMDRVVDDGETDSEVGLMMVSVGSGVTDC